jgi:hypothetical protein
VIPADLASQGFTSRPVGYESFGKFSASSGPRDRAQAPTPLAAVRCFLTDDVLALFLSSAKEKNLDGTVINETTLESFWRYFCATIGHGIVNYRQERDAYVHKNSSLSGLLGNDLLRSLHSLEQWKHAKKLWTLPRDTLTECFNKKSRDLWIPCQ